MVESDAAGIRANWNTRWRSDFGAIVAGAFVTVGVGLTLLSLGAAIGLTADPATELTVREAVIGGGVWTLLSIVVGTLIGSMVSVRLSAHYGRGEAACQGLCSWAVAFVGTIFYTSFVGALGAVGDVAAGAAPMVGDLGALGQQLGDRAAQGGGAAAQAADIGAWTSWGYFVTALFASLAGAVGGLWGLPATEDEDHRRARLGQPLRPADV
jgi:hypothetical protein